MAVPAIGYGLGSLALRAAPGVMRLGSRFFPRLIGGGAKTGTKATGTAVGPYLGGGATGSGGLPTIVGSGAKTGSSIFRGSSLGPITTAGTLMSLPYFIDNEAEISANQNQKSGISDEQRKRDAEDEQVGVGKRDKPDPVIDDINEGNLDDYISKNIGLFEKYLGDGKEKTKAVGFQALTEFGLNLATARGGNLIDKIARSAKDPLKTFAEIGKAAKNRADKIKMAAIETGIQQSEAEKDRAETDKPNDVKTLEYFLKIPGLKDKPIEELIRLSKSKATMSDEDFKKELILAFAPNIDRIGGPEKVEELVSGIMALGTGTGGGTAGGLSVQEQVDLAKEKGASNDQIKESLIKKGYNPADYGF
jgi:hypothetical protein